MERDDSETAARIQAVDRFFHRLAHRAQLIVYRNTDGLKAALGRMLLFAQRLGRHGAADDVHQLQRGLDRLFSALTLDGGCDQRSIALLAVFEQNVPDVLPAPRIDHIPRGERLLTVHAHIERRVLHIGEAALRMVELRRGNAEVEQDAVRTRKALPLEHAVDVAEVALDGGHAVPDRRETGLCVLERLVVAVDADQSASLTELLRDVQRMACAAGRGIHINAVRLDIHSFRSTET